MFDYIDETSGLYAELVPHIISPLEDCCFVFICGFVGRIDGDSVNIGYVIFSHDGVFILFYCDGRIDEFFVIILIGLHVFV